MRSAPKLSVSPSGHFRTKAYTSGPPGLGNHVYLGREHIKLQVHAYSLALPGIVSGPKYGKFAKGIGKAMITGDLVQAHLHDCTFDYVCITAIV